MPVLVFKSYKRIGNRVIESKMTMSIFIVRVGEGSHYLGEPG